MTLRPTPLTPADLAKVVQVFLAVTDSPVDAPDPHERQRAIDLAHQWAPREEIERIRAIVDTAYVAARSGVDIDALAEEICEQLSEDDCLRLLSDLGRIAQADGHLSVREAQVIARIRAAMGKRR